MLAWTLIGDRSMQSSNAQTQPLPPPGTDLIATSPDSVSTTGTLPSDIDPNGALAQVVRLLQAGVEQSVILTYISNSASPFNLNSDDIIYLNDLGASAEIVNSMMRRDQQLQQMGVAAGTSATPPANTTEETTTPQPAEVTVNYFYDTLAPYGGWVDVEGYGWCWRPTIVIYDAGWQPYCNNGHWVYTDQGWFWISGYSWGWATFHYGRWFHNPRYGWCWWPDTTWAPSWVCWRYNQDYCGWAPLPPHAVYRSGAGFIYDGHQVSTGLNFGLSVGAFTFVPARDFCDPQPWRHRIEAGEVARVYNQTAVINNIIFDSRHEGIVNAGIPLREITAVTRREIHPVTIRYEEEKIAPGHRHEQFEYDGRTLMVNRPHFVGSPVLTVQPGTVTPTEHRQNEFHPTVRGNENTVSPGLGNPARDNFPHSEINRNLNPNFNQTPPRMPQTWQSEVPRTTTSKSQEHNGTMAAPARNYSAWPTQNQPPNHDYGSDNRVLSPRAQGFEPQPWHSANHNPQPPGNLREEQHFSASPAVNHYSPPAEQHFNHSGPPPPAVQPHASHPASSSSSQPSARPGHNQDNDQRGH